LEPRRLSKELLDGARALEVERHYQPSRYMKRSEYIPTSTEIFNMALAAGSKRNRALVLAAYTSGLSARAFINTRFWMK
jgi:hypothetical protein